MRQVVAIVDVDECGRRLGGNSSVEGGASRCQGNSKLRWSAVAGSNRGSLVYLIYVASSAFILLITSPFAWADQASEFDAPGIETYEVVGRASRVVTASSSFVKSQQDFKHRVIESPGDLLEITPGLNVGQHAGGGKANQYLVRGFDADHGTDLGLSFGGVPINARSHAHLTGFADVHFVIPEILEEVEIVKGPYDVSAGDFTTAGSVNFVPKRSLDESLVKAEYGEFNTQRYLAAFSPRSSEHGARGIESLFAIEVYGSDGPLDSEENFWRGSAFGSFEAKIDSKNTLDGWISAYAAEWNASGQIPEREVVAGRLSRFGSIDPSEGGESQRYNGLIRLSHDASERTRVEMAAWALHYQLDLYSNFTFFMDDSVQGDGILQRDDRWSWGSWLVATHDFEPFYPASVRFGIEHQGDRVRARLDRQTRRNLIAAGGDDRLLENSLSVYGDVDVEPLPWIRLVAGARAELVWFDARDPRGLGSVEGGRFEHVLLPKASAVITPFGGAGIRATTNPTLSSIRLFVNVGQGFHSNDVRDAVSADPKSQGITRATGWEVGIRLSPLSSVEFAATYWWLKLQRELVFVADSGELELSPSSEREGFEVSVRWEPWSWLVWDGDVAYSQSRFRSGGDVPQAPQLIASSGLTAMHESGLGLDLRMRVLGDRAAEETCCTELQGYVVWNLGIRYERGPFAATLSVENLFDEEYRSAEFFYESQLPGEAAPQGDFHFVPGNPRSLRAGVALSF